MKKWIAVISICLAFVIGFIACKSKGGGNDTAPTVQTLTGKFVDGPVANLGYRTATQSGRTNANGEFLYQSGETVTFFIGAIELPGSSGSLIDHTYDSVQRAQHYRYAGC